MKNRDRVEQFLRDRLLVFPRYYPAIGCVDVMFEIPVFEEYAFCHRVIALQDAGSRSRYCFCFKKRMGQSRKGLWSYPKDSMIMNHVRDEVGVGYSNLRRLVKEVSCRHVKEVHPGLCNDRMLRSSQDVRVVQSCARNDFARLGRVSHSDLFFKRGYVRDDRDMCEYYHLVSVDVESALYRISVEPFSVAADKEHCLCSAARIVTTRGWHHTLSRSDDREIGGRIKESVLRLVERSLKHRDAQLSSVQLALL